jgi:hypothetical protein
MQLQSEVMEVSHLFMNLRAEEDTVQPVQVSNNLWLLNEQLRLFTFSIIFNTFRYSSSMLSIFLSVYLTYYLSPFYSLFVQF